MKDNEKQFEDFVHNIKFDDNPDAAHRDKLEKKLLNKLANQPQQKHWPLEIWRLIMNKTITKLATAAVIIIVVLSGVTFWSSDGSGKGKWWLRSSSVWAQEILTTLDTIEAVTCREQTVWIAPDGSKHTSSTWNVFYVSRDSYRRDIYDGDLLREIQWYVADGNNMVQTSVRFDLNSYFSERHKGSFGNRDPVERMRFYVRLLDNTKKLLGEKLIEDHRCIGFEISAGEYGNNPKEWLDRIWFDIDTKLPVLIEKERPYPRDKTQNDYHPHIGVQDQFDYNPELPSDTFIPEVPQGFIYGHPDRLKKR